VGRLGAAVSSGTVCHVVTEEAIAEATRRLVQALRPPAKVILFGSSARPDAVVRRDLDLLVIQAKVPSRQAEQLRLRRALRGLGIPIDLIVVSERDVEEWGRVPGTVLYDALREGRVLAET
jgi:predicted nucleotidyltransferase